MKDEHIEKVMQLLTEWNPLGEYASQIEDLNNYNTEAVDILFHIHKGSSIKRISQVISEVLTQAFAIDIEKQKADEVAAKIRDIIMDRK